MTIHTTVKTGMAGIALVLSLGLITACSTISEVRKAIPDVKADKDGGSVTIQGDDGESVTIDTNVDGEIPEWFPSELPLPDDHTVVSASEVQNGDESLKSLGVTSSVELDAAVKTIDEGLSAAALTPEARNVGDLGEMKNASYRVEVAGEVWMINIADYGDGDGLQIMYATRNEG